MMDPDLKEFSHYPLIAGLLAVAGWVGRHLIGHMNQGFRSVRRRMQKNHQEIKDQLARQRCKADCPQPWKPEPAPHPPEPHARKRP